MSLPTIYIVVGFKQCDDRAFVKAHPCRSIEGARILAATMNDQGFRPRISEAAMFEDELEAAVAAEDKPA